MLVGVDRLVKKPGEYLKTCEICGCLDGGDEYSRLTWYKAASIGSHLRLVGIYKLQVSHGDDYVTLMSVGIRRLLFLKSEGTDSRFF